MIDPIHSLAFSIQANPGVYAVLVGSGVSRAAMIPTGCEVTLDLIRGLATACDGANSFETEECYRKKLKLDLDYSGILCEIAKTRTARLQLIHRIFELNRVKREADEKMSRATQEPSFNGGWSL